MTRRWAILAGWMLLASLGCRRSVPEAVPAVAADPAELLSAIEAIREEAELVRRYQGMLRIRGKGPDGGFSGRLVVIFERPDWLRIELLGAFGSTRWSAIPDRDGITVVFPGPKQYLAESDTADIVGRLLGVRLDAEEVMALLSGAGVPLEKRSPVTGVRRGSVREARLATGTRLELLDDGQVRRAEVESYQVSYPSAWRERRRQIPDTVVLETPQIRATLTVDSVDVNVAIDPEAFTAEIPAGAERLRPSDVAGEAVFVAERPGATRR